MKAEFKFMEKIILIFIEKISYFLNVYCMNHLIISIV